MLAYGRNQYHFAQEWVEKKELSEKSITNRTSKDARDKAEG